MNKLFDFLHKNKVTPNGLYVLHAIKNKKLHQDFVNFQHEQYKLATLGFLIKERTDVAVVYKLTNEGLFLLRQAERYFSKKIVSKKVVQASLESWKPHIDEYNQMFPKQKRLNSGTYYRSNPKELEKKFVKFFDEYPEYTWDNVLDATENYIEQQLSSETGHKYTSSSGHFIYKQVSGKEHSKLADYCYALLNCTNSEITSPKDDGGFLYNTNK